MNNRNKKSTPSYGLGSWIKGAVNDVTDFASNNWTAAISPLSAIGGLTSNKSANDFTKANAGLIGTGAGAALGTMVGNPMLGAQIGGQIGGGVQQGYQQDLDQQQALTNQNMMSRQMIGNQRLQAYNQNKEQYNYSPTFKQGGILNSYANGGGVGNISPRTQAYAQYEAYKQPADSALIANYPQLEQIRANAPISRDERMQYADSVARANPNIRLNNLSNYLDANEAENLQMSRQQLVDYSDVNLQGTGPDADAYGIRNFLMPSGAGVSRYYNNELKAKYDVKYNPSTGEFIREDVPFKKGGKIYANGGSTYHAVKASETSGDDPKYPIDSASDVKDAWKLRNHAKGLKISQDTLNSRIKRKARQYDVDLNTNDKAMGGYLEESRYNPDVTTYASGGSTHESSPYGGIPIGNKGSVESGEVRYGDYIFSNRF